MANNEEAEETAPCRNEWEVVSLTQSAYAAAPSPKQVDLVDDSSAEFVAETSDGMFLSGHFILPPNQHEKLPSRPDNDEILNEQGGDKASPEFVADKGDNSDIYRENTKTKGLSMTEFPGDQFFDGKDSISSINGANFEEEDAAMQGLSSVDKEQDFFESTMYSSFHREEPLGGSASVEESNVLAEPIEPFHRGVDSDISNLPKANTEDNYDAANLPCQAWWKRRAVSLIAHAKDANAFWSIFIAAAVMGLVVIGQRWQLERWQVLQMKWQFGGHHEMMGRMFGPIARMKDVIIGGYRHGFVIRGSSSAQR